jgi:glucoselysine-6-phosphate deglycase
MKEIIMKTENSRIMLEEIAEESALFTAIMKDRVAITKDFVCLFLEHKIKRIYLSGSGSPSHIALILKYAAINLLHIEATYSYPALFNNHEGFNVGNNYSPEEMLLICPAESGRSKGPVIAARNAKKLGIPVVCTTLNPVGVLARESDVVIVKPSNHEVALPSTKGHSTGLFLLLLCFIEAARAIGSISEKEYDRYIDGCTRLPESCRDAREKTLQWFSNHQDIIMLAENYRLIGYGANYGTVMEAALKFIESHKRPSMGYELEEFMHGPIRSVRKDEVLFFLCTEDCPEKDHMIRLFRVMKQYTENCVLVQSRSDEFTDPLALTFNAVNMEFLSTVEYLVPMQVLAFEISDHLGLDMTIKTTLAVKEAMEPSFPE